MAGESITVPNSHIHTVFERYWASSPVDKEYTIEGIQLWGIISHIRLYNMWSKDFLIWLEIQLLCPYPYVEPYRSVDI